MTKFFQQNLTAYFQTHLLKLPVFISHESVLTLYKLFLIIYAKTENMVKKLTEKLFPG